MEEEDKREREREREREEEEEEEEEESREMHIPLYVSIQPKNVLNSVCHYVPIVCTHKAFAGRRSACRILIRICTK